MEIPSVKHKVSASESRPNGRRSALGDVPLQPRRSSGQSHVGLARQEMLYVIRRTSFTEHLRECRTR